jgi:hypothetical protein
MERFPRPGDVTRPPRPETVGVLLVIWEVELLHWKPRLIALAAVLALVLVALAGLGIELTYNLYW